jgi:hypothetical protein
VAEPIDPTQPRMRDWPMFRVALAKQARQARSSRSGGSPWPRIAELVMEYVPGTPSQKSAWLREQLVAGRLDGDDPEEIAQAEALLAMLMRFSGPKSDGKREHLDELVDEGLRETFPASDPVAVGSFTGTEPPRRPADTPAIAPAIGAKTKRRRVPAGGAPR